MTSVNQKDAMARLAAWVSKRRTELELTQDELAARTPYGKAHISKVETGRISDPPISFLEKLSAALEVSITAPLIEMGYLKRSPQDSKTISLLNYYQMLSEQDQRVADEIIKVLWRARSSTTESRTKGKKKTA